MSSQRTYRHLISLDLEMNTIPELNRDISPIIEIGVAVGDIHTRELVAKRHVFVNPGEPLDPRIIKLTTIQPTDVENAPCLRDTYSELAEWLEPFECSPQIITWGGADHFELKRQLALSGTPFKWVFGRSYVDVKILCQSILRAQGLKVQGGLAKNLTRFGMNFVGTKHRGIDDAVQTLRLYKVFLKLFSQITLPDGGKAGDFRIPVSILRADLLSKKFKDQLSAVDQSLLESLDDYLDTTDPESEVLPDGVQDLIHRTLRKKFDR